MSAGIFFVTDAVADLSTESTLLIGTKVGPSSLDPHYHASGENSTILPHIYGSLVQLGVDLQAKPDLAVTWKRVSERVWEFNLRRGVHFHNGDLFTARDVIFSFERVPYVEHSPGSYEPFTKRIARIEIVDDFQIRIHTEANHPYLLQDISSILIIPKSLGLQVKTSQFNSGQAAIGTGPFRVISWKPGQTLVLKRNEQYWGKKPQWEEAQLIPISSDPTRVAALMSGAVDMIDFVPLADRERLAETPWIQLCEHEAARIMFVHLDSDREVTPHVTDREGRPLKSNPLRNVKVRRALSLALDRQAIVKHLLDGAGQPAAQVLPPTFEGSSENLPVEECDLENARTLLAEAGYPDGFRVTLHSPSDRYPNDAKVAQAIAQMWWRIGVIAEVETLTRNVFFPAATRREFSAYFSGWGETTVAFALKGLVHSYDKQRGYGSGNRARYSNKEVDRLIEKSLVELDDSRRRALMARAQEIAFREDQGLIPMYHPTYAWAVRSSRLEYEANAEGATQAMRAHPTNEVHQ